MRDVESPSKGQDRERSASRETSSDSLLSSGVSIIARFKERYLKELIEFCELCPLVNYIYDVLLDDAPDPQNVKELLNLFALVSTLFLASAYGLAGTVTFGELQDADERWLNQSYPVQFSPQYTGNYYADLFYSNAWFWAQSSPHLGAPSMWLGIHLNMAISLLQGVIFAIILVYIDILAKDFNTTSQQFNFVMFEKWWFYARISVILIVVCLLLSLSSMFQTFNDVYMIKFPNYCPYIPNIDLSTPYVGSDDIDCTYQNVMHIQWRGLWIPMIIAMIVLSIGVARHYRNVRNHEKYFEEGSLSPVYGILKQVVLTADGASDSYRKNWEKKVLRDCFQGVIDNYVTYEEFVNADDALLKTLNINAHGHRKKILEITKLRKK